MKTTLKKMSGGAALGLALLANTSPTWAGLKANAEVVVENNVAQGSMTSARYSKDNKQKIRCSSGSSLAFGSWFAFCSATDKAGVTLACTTTNANLVRRVSAIIDSSIIMFSTQPGSSYCSTIHIDNGSFNLK